MIEDGIEEALRLARAGARGDDGGLRLVAVAGREALPGLELVEIGEVRGLDVERAGGGRSGEPG
jgi:hypothetical protein